MTANLEILSAVRTGSIQDVVNAVAKVLRGLLNLLKQSQITKDTFPNGRKRIEIKDLNSLELGMRGIWSAQGKCLLKRLKSTYQLRTDARNATKVLQIGIKKISKNAEHMIEQCMRSKQGNLFVLTSVQNAARNANRMRIMKITRNLWKLFGSVLCAISIYIINQNITVREQARKLRKGMRCSEPLTKAVEIHRNDVSPRNGVNRKWQAGGKSRFIYLPPGLNYALAKFSLIDLEAYESAA